MRKGIHNVFNNASTEVRIHYLIYFTVYFGLICFVLSLLLLLCFLVHDLYWKRSMVPFLEDHAGAKN